MCNHHTSAAIPGSHLGVVWRPDDNDDVILPMPAQPGSSELYRPDILETIEAKIKEMIAESRELSDDIHANPELGHKERHAHNVYTAFMKNHGFEVTKHYHLDTAWKATFSHGIGGRTIGINSEMDALPDIGHACGHNLIGMAGIVVACAIKAALEQHDLAGNILLLGTPAEENGSGKVTLLEKGAYEGMDACVMCHPAPGPKGSVSLSGSLAMQTSIFRYQGRTAHAALSPWEGINALDAAVLAYNNISVLRQQLKPTHLVHAIIQGKDWVPNIIPDYSELICVVRAPTRSEMLETVKRVNACFEAAGLATGCQLSIEQMETILDLRQNKALGDEIANVTLNKYGGIDYDWGLFSASTDFGNISYALPSLHPSFAIPTDLNGGNHTHPFAKAAATTAAYSACLHVCKALAATSVCVLIDDTFFAEVVRTFEEDEERGLL